MSTRTRISPVLVVLALCAVAMAVVVGPRLSSDDPDDRVLTLAAAWGDGTRPVPAARIAWRAGSQSDHDVPGSSGHWEKIVHVKKGDYVSVTVLTGPNVPVSTSITGRGVDVHGSGQAVLHAAP